jgi:sugar transferase (PEP-CTERM/EpsH1 system associated)
VEILLVTGNLPSPPTDGWKIRVFSLIRHLAERHRVSIASFIRTTEDRQAIEQLRPYCAEVQVLARPSQYSPWKLALGLVGHTPFPIVNYRDDRMMRLVRAMIRRRRFDVIQAESIHMAQYCLGLGPMTVLDLHNIESELMARYAEQEPNLLKAFYGRITARKLAVYERRICPQFSHCLTCSDEDRRLLHERTGMAAATVIPNGVELDEPAAFPEPDAGNSALPTCVFVGRMDYHANVDGVRWFCRDILPRIRAVRPVRFQIIGGYPSPEVRRLAVPNQVEVLGFVPHVRPYLQAADVVVVPLRVGGGTRLKILEAMAMGKGVVSTSVGAEGIQAVEGAGIMRADDPTAFANQVIGLLDDPQRRAEVGMAGKQLVRARYSWGRIAQDLERVYVSLGSRSIDGDPERVLSPRPVVELERVT